MAAAVWSLRCRDAVVVPLAAGAASGAAAAAGTTGVKTMLRIVVGRLVICIPVVVFQLKRCLRVVLGCLISLCLHSLLNRRVLYENVIKNASSALIKSPDER